MDTAVEQTLIIKVNKKTTNKSTNTKEINNKKSIVEALQNQKKLFKKKCPEGRLITFEVYFDNDKVYLKILVEEYITEHTDTKNDQE